MKRVTPIRLASFFLWTACGALSQSLCPSPVLTPASHSYAPPDQRRQELQIAPAVQPPTQTERSPAFIDELRSPLNLRALALNVDPMRETESGHLSHKLRPVFAVSYAVSYQEPNTFLDRYLHRSLVSQNLRYPRSTSVSFVGRVTYAASRIFITRDNSGQRRLNTSYFLGVLSSIAIHTARSPYWTRSPSAPFSDFGSTIGNDAGVNLFHEFGPGLHQIVKGHTPKFVSKIEARITRDRNPRGAISTPAR